jgi:hypothetical protein
MDKVIGSPGVDSGRCLDTLCQSSIERLTCVGQVREAGLRVRSAVRAGDWSCEHCQGQVKGDQLFKPTCDICYRG